mmetsp:Transcript_28457/g.56906  ORF Transcript_28457/g.56906 Transcript_28457/m.56906 type:complete len:243 (+) Transcript_28457:68-796(+)
MKASDPDPISLPKDYLHPLLVLQARSIPVTIEAICSSYAACKSRLDSSSPQERAISQPKLMKVHTATLVQYRQASLSAVASARVTWSKAVVDGSLTADVAVERFREAVAGWGGSDNLPEAAAVRAEIEKAVKVISRKKRRRSAPEGTHNTTEEDHSVSAPRKRNRSLPIPSDNEEEPEQEEQKPAKKKAKAKAKPAGKTEPKQGATELDRAREEARDAQEANINRAVVKKRGGRGRAGKKAR